MTKIRFVFRRLSRYRSILRFFQWGFSLCLLLLLLDLLRDSWRPSLPSHHVATAQDLRSNNITSVYIASVQWNSEEILQSGWLSVLLELVVALQAVNINVYVSIYEGGSRDGTKKVLSQLTDSLRQLNINNSIELDPESREDSIDKASSGPDGWLQTPHGKELRRIVYLSAVRNRALEPLLKLNKAGAKFDKILYLNDIVYSVGLIIDLLIFY